jgi:hypothetical protein
MDELMKLARSWTLGAAGSSLWNLDLGGLASGLGGMLGKKG